MDQIERDVEPQGLSRRTVVTAAAWAAPVVALASAAPMAAASPPPPTAIRSQITVDQNNPVGEPGQIIVKGRTTEGGLPVDGALPSGTYFTLTPEPSTGNITILPSGRVGIASVTGPDANGVYTVTPVAGIVTASLYASLDVAGKITVQMYGDAPGGPSSGTWV